MVTKDMCLPAHGTMIVDISTAWLRAVLSYNVGYYIVQNVVVYNSLLFLSFKTFGHKAFIKFEKTLKTPKSWSKTSATRPTFNLLFPNVVKHGVECLTSISRMVWGREDWERRWIFHRCESFV